MKIDIIIPAYNVSAEELERCLTSIDKQTIINQITVTIIDDCSTEQHYDEIQDLNNFSPNILYLEKNSGPGVARQHGINSTTGDLITFIDADDYLMCENAIELLATPFENPEVMETAGVCACQEGPNLREYSIVKYPISTLHGKMYRRSFLDKYEITFNSTSSYMHEDNAFNSLCGMCMHNKGEIIHYIDEFVYCYCSSPNGLTAKTKGHDYIITYMKSMMSAEKHAINKIGHSGRIDFHVMHTMVQAYYLFVEQLAKEKQVFDETFEIFKTYYEEVFRQSAFIVPRETILEAYKGKSKAVYDSYELDWIPCISFIDFLFLFLDEDNEIDKAIISKLL